MSVFEDIQALGEVGRSRGGLTRLAWTPELDRAHRWLRTEMEALGLNATTDEAGNLIGKWNIGRGQAIVVGSHLDTVRNAGLFDGTLGVVAALHSVRSLRARRVVPRRPIWIVSFMDEEGTRFSTGTFGSRAFVGDDLSELRERTDETGVRLADAMLEQGLQFERAADADGRAHVAAFLEVHIEQGPTLWEQGVDLGVVSSICGIAQLEVEFRGEQNHAGTTPMSRRRDALLGAAEAAVTVHDAARTSGELIATVGALAVEPGVANVIPGSCTATFDLRAPTADAFQRAETMTIEAVERAARDRGLTCTVRELERFEPVALDDPLQTVLEAAAHDVGATTMRLPSGAVHDAGVLARHVPAALLFAPSQQGVSHSPNEFTDAHSCELAARVLTVALERLAVA